MSLDLYWIAHPADVARDYGVTLYPLVFVLEGRRVVAVRSVRTRKAVLDLVREAFASESDRPALHQVEGVPASDSHAGST